MIVVWMNPSAIADVKRLAAQDHQIAGNRCYNALKGKASPADANPRPVARFVGSSNQIDSKPNMRMTVGATSMPCRVQNRILVSR
jgi:hypothetical protein